MARRRGRLLLPCWNSLGLYSMGVIYFIPGVGIRATAMPVASVLSMKSLNLKSYTFTKKQHATYGSRSE